MNKRKASEGMWLTQSQLTEEEGRIFVKEVAGYGDLDNLFTEWSDEQKTQWEEEHPEGEEGEGNL